MFLMSFSYLYQYTSIRTQDYILLEYTIKVWVTCLTIFVLFTRIYKIQHHILLER
jgi:hypothetical protein